MAMDALNNLTGNIPDWLKRLDELSTQVDKRQAELAAASAALGEKSAETRSLRHKGSTESLKPNDDGPSNIQDPTSTNASAVPRIDEAPEEAEAPASPEVAAAPVAESPQKAPAASLDGDSNKVPQTKATAGAADTRGVEARAPQTGEKRQRPASVLSGDASKTTYRTRNMIIVYYDSYVQSFFDDLVRFVSSSRNLVRKAKMAKKVAQIKRMAERDGDADGSNAEDDDFGLPSLRYTRSRRLGPMGGDSRQSGSFHHQTPDVYDNLDKGLEFVQSTCEHGAHQFLRDAKCGDEIVKTQKHLQEVFEIAEREAQRVKTEEPELAQETGEAAKARARRPISMRRETMSSKKGENPQGEITESSQAKSQPPAPDVSAPLEVDSDEDEDDEGVEMEPPKVMFRSTRYMRRGGRVA